MIEKRYNIQLIIRIITELTLVIISTIGVIISATKSGFMGGGTTLLYFTIQSNITISFICFVFAINYILMLLGKKDFVNDALRIVKYIFTIAISITFLIYTIFLAPTMGLKYNLGYSNISLHFLTPILAIADFFVFDNKMNLNAKNCLFGLAMPVYYLIFFLVGIPLGFRYYGDAVAPYFFLNYKTLTWFNITPKGIGVFYWILIVTVIVIAICYLFLLLFKLRNKTLIKKHNKYDEDEVISNE